MSAIDPRHPQGTDLVPEPQDERLPVGRLALIAIVTLVLFAVGVIWSTLILNNTRDEVIAQTGVPRAPSELGKAEIGIVDQQLFSREQRADHLRQEKAQRLGNAGWASRRDNLVHIPISDAMRAVANGRRPAGSAPPAPEPMPELETGVDGGIVPPVVPAPTPAGPGNDTMNPPDQQTPGATGR